MSRSSFWLQHLPQQAAGWPHLQTVTATWPQPPDPRTQLTAQVAWTESAATTQGSGHSLGSAYAAATCSPWTPASETELLNLLLSSCGLRIGTHPASGLHLPRDQERVRLAGRVLARLPDSQYPGGLNLSMFAALRGHQDLGTALQELHFALPPLHRKGQRLSGHLQCVWHSVRDQHRLDLRHDPDPSVPDDADVWLDFAPLPWTDAP